MRLEYRLTLNEYLAAMEADGKARNPWLFSSCTTILWCITIFLIIIALIFGFFSIIFDYIDFSSITFSILMFLGAIFISPPILKRFYRWQISGYYKDTVRLHECLTVDLNENTIQFTSEDSKTKIKWEGLDYFIEADDVFNLYISKITYHIIPKRAFSNNEQLDRFRNIVIEKINNEHSFFSSAITIKRKYFYIALLSIVAFSTLTVLFPSNRDQYRDQYYWLNKGNNLYAENKYEEAIDSYKKSIDIDPKNANAWYNIGLILEELKRHEESLFYHKKALEIDPKYFNAWYSKGLILDKLERYREALDSYDNALDIKPEYTYIWFVWYRRGRALHKLKRYKEALASYDNTLDTKPEYANAWIGRGLALGNLKRYEEALASFDKALEIDPNNQFVIKHRQRLLTELGSSQ